MCLVTLAVFWQRAVVFDDLDGATKAKMVDVAILHASGDRVEGCSD